MESEKLTLKIKELQQEYQKGIALIEDTKAKMFRIEGAIIQLQELMKQMSEEKPPRLFQNDKQEEHREPALTSN